MNIFKRIGVLVLAVAITVTLMLSTGINASALNGVGSSSEYIRKHGIDLSYWNVGGNTLNYSLVDFDKLAASGCEFAILRIGLGNSSGGATMDKAFLEFYNRARAAGMPLGIYFYSHATTYSHAVKEANWVISMIEKYDLYFEYPIYTDMEESDQTSLSNSAFTNVALGFCETMEAAGYFPAMYGANSSMSKLSSAFCARYDRWTAKVKANETTTNRFYWDTYDYSGSFGMWQYTWEGQNIFSGIGASMLDVNICYKDYPAIMAQYGYNRVKGSGTTAEKLGTYYITASTDDPLNVRSEASTSGSIVDTVKLGDLVNVTQLSGNWGNFVSPNGSNGWASIKNYSEYIGVDALAGTTGAAWGTVDMSVDADGRMTLVNNSNEQVAYDFKLPFDIGTSTTPYFCIAVVPNSGSGYYFGLTQEGSGYFMMRDCNSGDQLVNATTAPYMTGQEQLEINMKDWWPTADYRINMVRMYIAPNTSITVNYMYFAATSGKVISEAYNLNKGTGSTVTPSEMYNKNLMRPESIYISDIAKAGSFSYYDGRLTVVSEEESGYEVAFDVDLEFNPETYKRWLVSFEGDVRYDVAMCVTTSEGDKWISLVSDFWPSMVEALDGEYIPATGATQSWGLDLLSAYTYNNVLPADGVSTIKSIAVKLGGKGTLHVNSLQIASEDVLVGYWDGLSYSGSSDGSSTDAPSVPDTDEPDAARMIGDIDNDGVITTADARMVLQYTIGSVSLDANQISLCDYDGNGIIETADARDILIATL